MINPLGDSRFKFFYACRKARICDDSESLKQLISGLYLGGLSCNALSEYFWEKYQISVSPRNLNDYTDNLGITRSASEAKKLAMKKKRMIYRKKPEIEKYHGKYVSAGTRLTILERDRFGCVLCGNGRQNGYSLEIHHKDFDEQNNDHDNLQTLCFLCHRGIHAKKK